MDDTNRKIIDAVVAKADIVCPRSLALVGIYGSVATGDVHAGSDLDLLILIDDDGGYKLGTAFILEDRKVGYDIYCTSWEGLRRDAACHHAQLSKLLDSKPVYVRNKATLAELDALREQARAFLRSEERFGRVDELLQRAKASYADACLHEGLGQARVKAAEVVLSLLDAVMLYHGCYFRRGVKRLFEELSQFPLEPEFLGNLRRIPMGGDVPELRGLMKSLILYVEGYTLRRRKPQKPSADSVSGTYEEMYSNWRNKVAEAAASGDAFSAFMSMCSLQHMVSELAAGTAVGAYDIMQAYDGCRLENNVRVFDDFLATYERVYAKAGLTVRRYPDADGFVADYLGS